MRIIVLVFFFLIVNVSYSQNLVPNSGFEQYSSCPTVVDGQIDKLLDWYEVRSSADYYNCSMGVPNNGFGSQLPNNGSGYVGLGSSEVIAVKLIEPLESNKTYLVELYVSLSEGFAPTQNIGVHFSQDSICEFTDISNLQISSSQGQIDDTINWVKISGSYIAQGCEQYLA